MHKLIPVLILILILTGVFYVINGNSFGLDFMSSDATYSTSVPKGVTFRMGLNKSTFYQYEKPQVSLVAVNRTKQPQTLEFSTGCQTDVSIGDYWRWSNINPCPLAMTRIVIEPRQSYTWKLEADLSNVPVGRQKLIGEVVGYYKASRVINVKGQEVVNPEPTKPQTFSFITPEKGARLTAGKEYEIKWTGAEIPQPGMPCGSDATNIICPSPVSEVKLYLYQGDKCLQVMPVICGGPSLLSGNRDGSLNGSLTSGNSFSWNIPREIAGANFYITGVRGTERVQSGAFSIYTALGGGGSAGGPINSGSSGSSFAP